MSDEDRPPALPKRVPGASPLGDNRVVTSPTFPLQNSGDELSAPYPNDDTLPHLNRSDIIASLYLAELYKPYKADGRDLHMCKIAHIDYLAECVMAAQGSETIREINLNDYERVVKGKPTYVKPHNPGEHRVAKTPHLKKQEVIEALVIADSKAAYYKAPEQDSWSYMADAILEAQSSDKIRRENRAECEVLEKTLHTSSATAGESHATRVRGRHAQPTPSGRE